MSYYEFLLMIRRYRWWYLLLFVVVFAASFYLLKPRVLTFRGLSTFYLANDNLANPIGILQKGQEDIMHISVAKERIFQFVFSTEMMNHLIEKFDLYNHYGIDSTKKYHYEIMVKRLSLAVSFNKVTPDLFQVSVIDKNNIVAAEMTNEVVTKLNEINQKYLLDKIQANLNFFETYLQVSANTSVEQNKKLFEYMELLNRQRLQTGKVNDTSKPLSQIEFAIYQAAAKIEEVTTQLIEARNLYDKALHNRQSNNVPSIIVLKKALPELAGKFDLLVIFSMLASLVAVTTLIILMFLFFHFNTDLQIVFGKSLPEKIPRH